MSEMSAIDKAKDLAINGTDVGRLADHIVEYANTEMVGAYAADVIMGITAALMHLQLVHAHKALERTNPWASPEEIQRALNVVFAEAMDRATRDLALHPAVCYQRSLWLSFLLFGDGGDRCAEVREGDHE